MWHQQPEITGQAADVGKTLIQGMAPAKEGWILAFIVIVALITGSDLWIGMKTLEANTMVSEQTRKYFEMVEENRASSARDAHATYADQVRRSQEVIRSLAESISRDSERAGDAALMAIRDKSQAQRVESAVESVSEAVEEPNMSLRPPPPRPPGVPLSRPNQ